MKHVQSCLSASKDLESSFHHCGSPVKRLFKYQETTRIQFSPLWRFCNAPASLFMCGKDLRKPF